MKPLPLSFYSRDTVTVARELLGKILVRKTDGQILTGRIIETEAYTGPGDPASHAFRGPTPRSRIMFGPPGIAYVYFCYGVHHLLNVVTEEERTAGAVLIRGLEPLEGIERMIENRKRKRKTELVNGPGKLTQALKIDLDLNGWNLTEGRELYIIKGQRQPGEQFVAAPRVGIKNGTDKLWRFSLS